MTRCRWRIRPAGVASDSADTYSRDPSGQITGVDGGGTRVIALDDGHNDLSGTFTASGTSMTSSTTWDPWGAVLASAGPAIQVGYQGQWTDPVSQQVNMGSRMYSAGYYSSGPRFINKDTGPGKTDDAVTSMYGYAGDNPMTFTDPTGHMSTYPDAGGGDGTVVSAGDVRAAKAQVAAGEQAVKKIKTELRQADADLAQDDQDASGYAEMARQFNAAAQPIMTAANQVQAEAKQAYEQAQRELAQEPGLKNAVEQAENNLTGLQDLISNPRTNPAIRQAAKDNLADAEQAVTQAQDAYNAVVNAYQGDLADQSQLNEQAGQIALKAAVAQSKAKGYDARAAAARQAAAAARQDASSLSAQLAKAEGALSNAEAKFSELDQEYQTAEALAAKDKDTHKGGGCGFLGYKCVGKVAAKVGDVAIALAGGPDLLGTPCEDEEENEEGDPEEGGESFTAGTLVLLADGKTMPISKLKPGDKVLATSTKTGKTQPETITAVLVHHDTDRYDLTIRAGTRTAVIDTTSNHLFFVPGTSGNSGRWVKAGALKYGTHLRTPDSSDTAVVTGGWVPSQRDGWMWDLTVPGNNDHNFYIDTTVGSVLVHNSSCVNMPSSKKVSIDMDEVLSGHTSTGTRYLNSAAAGKGKDVFPDTMGPGEIENAIRQAYGDATKAGPTQYRSNGDVVSYVKGTYDGMEIYMYVNVTTRVIETAWPKYP